MDREDVQKLLQLADEHYERGRFELALDAYEVLAESQPHLAWAYSRMGAIHAQLGDTVAAEQALVKAIELDPGLPQAHSNLGNLHYSRGEYDQALIKYKEAAKLDPQNPVFHQNLHAAYRRLGKIGDAVAALKQVHKLEREATKTAAKSNFDNVKRNVKGRAGCMTMTLFLFALASLTLLVTT